MRLDQLTQQLAAEQTEGLDWAHLENEFTTLAELLLADGYNQNAHQVHEAAAALGSCKKGRKAKKTKLSAVEMAAKTLADLEAAIRALKEETLADTALDYSEIEAQLAGRVVCTEDDLIDTADLTALCAASSAAEATSVVDDGLLEDFIREAHEHLEAAEQDLLFLENDPHDMERLNAVFRGFHTIKGVAGFIGLDTLAALAHESENLLDKAREGKLPLVGVAMDCIFTSVDTLKRLLTIIAAEGSEGDRRHRDSITSLLKNLAQIASGERIAEPATPTVETEEAELNSTDDGDAPADVPGEPSGRNNPTLAAQAETLRVDRHRLDDLVDMIGELVIAESMVQQDLSLAGHDDPHASRNLAQLNKITRNLQELSLSLRMVPIRATFQKMARLVRDLSKRMGKPIEFQMSGEDTELDKTVVDELSDPLMHMIRNAVDHGIEATTDERVAAGKDPRGKVLLKAYHQGGNIFVEIHDDGRGMNVEKLHRKAVDLGIIAPDARLPDNELMQLIFHAGFSTAEKVTDVSGRGVGMDVVRRNIESLRGTVDVRSTLGEGSRFSIRLPLTLAIIDGMAVSVGQQRYILPTLSIVELICPKPEDIQTVKEQGEYFQLRDECLPLLRVNELLGQAPSTMRPEHQIIVVVDSERKRAGLLVDAVLGQHQAVIKTLGHSLEEIPGMSGGAVMPDGRVGLILDIHGLLEMQTSVHPAVRETLQTDSLSVGPE